jgi:hypothetical protein
MGETRVDLHHLLEDLRDAYPGSLEETILTEIVANSLDSGASYISLRTNQPESTLTVTDDGSGMTRLQLRRYHDLATSTKQRGAGIGFAGVGIKLGLLACENVLTESHSGTKHVATLWHLKSRHRAPWKWVDPPGLAGKRGTAVRLTLNNPLSELLDEGYIENVLRRHFQPLLDPDFGEVLHAAYPRGVIFGVNGRDLAPEPAPEERTRVAVRLPRKRKPAAAGYVFRSDAPLPEDVRGIAVATLGKVIKRGWDWLGITPAAGDRIGGLIDAPPLADCLTLNKADFLRTGTRGATYLAFRKAIQEALAEPLEEWGERHAQTEETRRRKARPLERDLKTVLGRLAVDFPLLDALAMRRPGGQRQLPFGGGSAAADASQLRPVVLATHEDLESTAAERVVEPEAPIQPEPAASAERPESERRADLAQTGRKRRAHLGLRIDFEQRPDDHALGRLVESTIWVNESHPAYRRALTSRLQAYHLAVTVAMTLAPLAVEARQVHEFVSAFLDRWGKVDEKRK